MIKISIVTISFNQFKFLKDCMSSVISQMTEEIEYIVVDPGSSDGSRKYIQSYGSKIKTVFDLDSGPSDGLNNGFSKAKGQYYYFLNSDDILLPGAVNSMLLAIKNNILADVFCFRGYLVDEDLFHLRYMRTFNFSAKRFCRGNTSIYQQGLLFSSFRFKQVGGFNKDNKTCWDAELAVKMSLKGAQFIDMPDVISYFRIYSTSITGSANNLIENSKNKNRLFKLTFNKKPSLFNKFIYQIVKFEKYFYFDYLAKYLHLKIMNFKKKSANQL